MLRQTVFGDAPLDVWTARGAGQPWDSFERARELAQAGQRAEAVRVWRQITSAGGLESRHTLQAWHFLRQAGQPPPPDQARLVLGVAVEMPARKGLTCWQPTGTGQPGTFNYSGKAVIWEDHSDIRIQAAITNWLTAGQVIADAIGVWEQPSLPPLPAGDARLMMLTPGGHRFGQASAAALSQDLQAGPFLTAATRLLQLITSRA